MRQSLRASAYTVRATNSHVYKPTLTLPSHQSRRSLQECDVASHRRLSSQLVTCSLVVARIINDDEHADPTTAVADKRRDVTKRPISHAAIVDAYDWDDVHPSRCVIL